MQSLEDDDLDNFTNYISAALESGADLNHQYGGESGYKTILHLALEEDDGLPYVEELLKVFTLLTHQIHPQVFDELNIFFRSGCRPIFTTRNLVLARFMLQPMKEKEKKLTS